MPGKRHSTLGVQVTGTDTLVHVGTGELPEVEF
jgi:hypothetical protein